MYILDVDRWARRDIISDGDGWAGGNIITDGDGWAQLSNMQSRMGMYIMDSWAEERCKANIIL
jgi:hypothetical protein